VIKAVKFKITMKEKKFVSDLGLKKTKKKLAWKQYVTVTMLKSIRLETRHF
jgi:hypothetical protein